MNAEFKADAFSRPRWQGVRIEGITKYRDDLEAVANDLLESGYRPLGKYDANGLNLGEADYGFVWTEGSARHGYITILSVI